MSGIAVAGFYHETNTFAPHKADLQAFRQAGSLPGLMVGEAVAERFADLNVPLSGAMRALREQGRAVVPIAWASAVPSGFVTAEAYEHIAGIIADGIRAAMPLEGVYLDLHGAMVAEGKRDCSSDLVGRVRRQIGHKVPLVASFDLHGNLSEGLVSRVDALTVFRTYPHVDMADTGARAARLLAGVIARGRPFARAIRKLPFLVPLHAQCTLSDPAARLYALAERLSERPGVEAVDLALGFPPADTPECGPAVVACGSDAAAVDRAADGLAAAVEAAEGEFSVPLLDADAAVAKAMENRGRRPVVIADSQDNPGCGGTGGTVGMLAALLRHDAEEAVFAILFDPAAVRLAREKGVGGRSVFTLGSSADTPGDRPITAEFDVELLTDGDVQTSGPMYGGNMWHLGGVALLRRGGVRVVVAERRQQAADQAVLRHVGLDPRRLKIIVLKSTVHFRADFQDLADDVLVAVAPGLHLADNTQYDYVNLRPHVRLMPKGPGFIPGRDGPRSPAGAAQ